MAIQNVYRDRRGDGIITRPPLSACRRNGRYENKKQKQKIHIYANGKRAHSKKKEIAV